MSARSETDDIEEVERRLSYRVTRDFIAVHRRGADIEETIQRLEAQKQQLMATSMYLGEKPSSCPRAPVIRKEHAHFIGADDPIIAVQVGGISDTKKIVHIHQSVLTNSEFFKAKVKPEWSTGGAAIDLQHISVGAFTMYANWAYSGKIAHKGRDLNAKVDYRGGNDTNKKAGLPDADVWQTLAEAAALGEELMDGGFKHSVLDTMILTAGMVREGGDEVARQVICRAGAVSSVYEGTPEGSGARKFMVDLFTRNKNFLEKCEEEMPNAFLRDMAVSLLKGEDKNVRALFANSCLYHQHAEGEACYSTTAQNWKAMFGDMV